MVREITTFTTTQSNNSNSSKGPFFNHHHPTYIIIIITVIPFFYSQLHILYVVQIKLYSIIKIITDITAQTVGIKFSFYLNTVAEVWNNIIYYYSH